MAEQNAESGIVTCIYCGGLEDAAEMTDVPMEESDHVTIDPADLPTGVAECVVWQTRIAHKCRRCMKAEQDVVQ